MITQYKAADPLDPTSQAEYKLLAGGATRTWVGTEDAYNAEKNNIPNNTMICITDDNMDVDAYSTTETKTNKVWIDGKPIYRKVVDVGNIPDTTSKSIAHNIANIGTIIICEGRAVANTTAKTSIGLPYVNTDSSTVCIQVYANVTNVVVKTASGSWINYVGFVILEYTKTAG